MPQLAGAWVDDEGVYDSADAEGVGGLDAPHTHRISPLHTQTHTHTHTHTHTLKHSHTHTNTHTHTHVVVFY